MKKIKVQSRMSVFMLAIIVLVCIALIGAVFYFIILDRTSTFSYRVRSDGWELISALIIFLPFLFREVMKKGQYVSDLIVADSFIQLVYKEKGKITEIETINTSDIKSFNVNVHISVIYAGRRKSADVTNFVDIRLKSGEVISFEAVPSALNFSFCAYNFILDLIKVSENIPNFTYKINTDEQAFKYDIQYFAQHGKRMPLHKQKGGKALIVIYSFLLLWIVLAVGTIGFICFQDYMPKPKLASNEARYMELYDDANDYYTKYNDYDEALKYLSEAKSYVNNDYQLYLLEAYVYKYKHDYRNVLNSANKAIVLLNSNQKSVYNKAKRFNYPGIKKSGLVAAYTLKGKAHYKLEEYALSADAYTNVIENCYYKYTDAYFRRGVSKFYAGDKQGALIDFIEHKGIINRYFEEMSDMSYPTYTQKDLELVNKWISACKN
ncbi:hypothetical protein IJ818_07380 [bacterium]|nr:hypothetical protein [bacterium]